MIRVAYDKAGLKQAARELLEESRTRVERERLRRAAESAAPEQREKILAGLGVRTLPAAYYERILYLAQLDELVERGLASCLSIAEWTGLRALAEARFEHEEKHPPCPACGKGLDSAASFSCRCGWKKPVKGKAA